MPRSPSLCTARCFPLTPAPSPPTLADPKPHLLKDPESETRYGIALPDLLRKAEAYKTGAAGQVGLLSGVTFYATKQVETEFDVLKRIVEAHKGKVRRTGYRFASPPDLPAD